MIWILFLSAISAFAVTALLPSGRHPARPANRVPRSTRAQEIARRPDALRRRPLRRRGIPRHARGGLAGAWLIEHGTTFGLPTGVTQYARGAVSKTQDLLLPLGRIAGDPALGTLDDRRKLRPATKLLIETLVATGFVIGTEAPLALLGGFLRGRSRGGAVTVLWIVG